jgi:protein TonB
MKIDMTEYSNSRKYSTQEPLRDRLRALFRPGHRWFAPILFALALVLGLAIGALWLHTHAMQPVPAAAGAAIVADPTHPPLPTPTPGASTLPPAVQSAPGAAYIASRPAAAEADDAVDTATQASTSTTQESAASPATATPAGGDSEAQVIQRTQPDYPAESLQAGEEGEVRLQVALDALGNVEDVRVVSSSGSHTLDRAAISAVRVWRFRPARHAGEAISGITDVSVNFHMDEQR